MFKPIKTRLDEELKKLIDNLSEIHPNVDFNIIIERVKLYGNNFPDIAEAWNDYFKSNRLIIKDVINLMNIMKKTRAKCHGETEDNRIDIINYQWIADYYPTYLIIVGLIDTINALDMNLNLGS